MHRLVPPHVQQLASQGSPTDSDTGAALIIDAAGSTALASRLQPSGTTGAEAFADVLTAIFRPMVDRVISEGGSVAELAGDGILAVFTGEPVEAVSRAVRAASGVMDDLTMISELDTPDGPAKLLVRCVVGAGSVEWVIWSSDDPDASQQAAYAVVGTALGDARRGEAITPGGVVAASPTAATHLQKDLRTSALSHGYVEVRPNSVAIPATNGNTGSPSTNVLRFHPDEVVGATLRGEFRDVVSVFVEFDNVETRAMEQLLSATSRHRGYLNHVTSPTGNITAFRSFVLWGAPTSHEHDIGYALRFLEDLRADHGNGMRAGVTRSTAFTGFIGSPQREVYTAIGPGVSLAARICDAAPWGHIWIDPSITPRLIAPWGFESVGDLEYRGFSSPIETFQITYVPPVRVAEPLHGPLIGREDELDQLEDMLAPLWAGRAAGVIAIAGQPGIGKSRLIGSLRERLAERSPGPVWLSARADEIRSQPLATLRDALAGYFGKPGREESGIRLDTYLHELHRGSPDTTELGRTRRALGDLLQLAPDVKSAEKLDAKTRFENLVISVENLVRDVGRTAPVIVAISDAHWMDPGTAEVLRRISVDLRGESMAIILETRDTASGLQPDHVVEVGPLDARHIESLIHLSLPESVSSDLVDVIVERSGGNPFFAEQLIEYVGRTASGAQHVLAGSPAEIPDDMRRLLVARIDGLPLEVRRAVQMASVLGREVDIDVLEKMLRDPGRLESSLETAANAGIWERIDDAHMAFANVMIRDAAYGMMLHSDARQLHATAALAITTNPSGKGHSDAELAHHYDRAGNALLAADHYVSAGEKAAERYDNQQAHIYLARALELTPTDDHDRRYAALGLKQSVYEVEGDRASQDAIISAMEQLVGADDTRRFLEVAQLRIKLLVTLGEYADAKGLVTAALPLSADPAFVAERARLTFLSANLARYQGRLEEALRLGETARSLFRLSGEDTEVATVEDFTGGIAWESGDFEDAARLHESSARIFGAAGRVVEETRALNNMATAIFSIGDYSRAREIHRSGAERSREIGYRMGEGDHLDNMGGTAWAVGDFELALEYYNQALTIREGMDDAWGIAISKGNLGATRRAMGDHDRALALYREALEVDRRIGRRRGEAYDLHGIGLCHLDLNRYNLAMEALGQAARLREELGETHLANESHVACAVAMLRTGDQADAAALVDSVLADEGENFFAGAVETTATRLRCIEVLESSAPIVARALQERTIQGVLDRAAQISDADQRRSYLEQVESHSRALGVDTREQPQTPGPGS